MHDRARDPHERTPPVLHCDQPLHCEQPDSLRCAIGRDLLLDTPDGPLLADTRLLAGWPLHPTTAAPTGLTLRTCDYAHSDNAAAQASLF